jgi:Ala-tRNA(Pro) deacylase
MGIAARLQEYLESHAIEYEVIEHASADSVVRAAAAAKVPADRVAKPVLLGDDDSYLLAVIPATHRLDVDRLNQMFRRSLEPLPPDEIEATFYDCEGGAIPPIGQPYGVDVLVDTTLVHQPDIYFEPGDHKHLIHLRGEDFRGLMADAPKAQISHHF